jgi:hypothetical protein
MVMKVQEAKGVCRDCGKEGSDLCLPQWETGVMLCIMYVGGIKSKNPQ